MSKYLRRWKQPYIWFLLRPVCASSCSMAHKKLLFLLRKLLASNALFWFNIYLTHFRFGFFAGSGGGDFPCSFRFYPFGFLCPESDSSSSPLRPFWNFASRAVGKCLLRAFNCLPSDSPKGTVRTYSSIFLKAKNLYLIMPNK